MYEHDTNQNGPEIANETTLNRLFKRIGAAITPIDPIGSQSLRSVDPSGDVMARHSIILPDNLAHETDLSSLNSGDHNNRPVGSSRLQQFFAQVGSPPGQAFGSAGGPNSRLREHGQHSSSLPQSYGIGTNPSQEIFHRAGISMDPMLRASGANGHRQGYFAEPSPSASADHAQTAHPNAQSSSNQQGRSGMASSHAAGKTVSNTKAPGKGHGHKNTHHHRHTKAHQPVWVEKNPSNLPQNATEALRAAMKLEGVPDDQFNDLAWIMAQESEGVADVSNPKKGSSARGLFQLLQNNYHYNPNGIRSFGNPVEEAQGGIRYMKQRYKNASAARQFWQKKKWW